MAVSRQREYLADASSVELTRNPHGLESALAKIASDNDAAPLGQRRYPAPVHRQSTQEARRRLGPVFDPSADRRSHQQAPAADRRRADGPVRNAVSDRSGVGEQRRQPRTPRPEWRPFGCLAAFRSVVVPFHAPTGSQSVSQRAEIAQSVEHATENRGVASSILALGTKQVAGMVLSSGSGSVGRASPCQGEGRGFESRLPLHSLLLFARRRCPPTVRASAPSSSGRTADFGSVRRGSKSSRGSQSDNRDPLPAPCRGGHVRGDVPKWLRGRSAKPLFSGSIPLVASTFPLEFGPQALLCLDPAVGGGQGDSGDLPGALTFWSCRSGGIGRRSGLKLRGPQGRQGSNPCSGTRSDLTLVRLSRTGIGVRYA